MPSRIWFLAGLLALLLVGNVVFFVASRSTSEASAIEPGAARSEGVLYARALDNDRIVTGGRDNVLTVLDDGTELQRTDFPGSLRALAVSPVSIVAGGSDGTVVVYDHALRPVADGRVEGQVVAIAANDSGAFVVVHGPGGFANRATLSVFREAGAEPSSFDVPFNVTALAIDEATAYIGTLNSRVQARSLDDGSERWTATLDQPLAFLAVAPGDSAILAGDSDGGVTVLGFDGDAGSRLALGSSPIRTAAFDPEPETWLVGDSGGRIHAVGGGTVTYSTSLAEGDIALVASGGDGRFAIVPRDGLWQSFNLTAVDATRNAALVSRAWITFAATAGVAAAGAALWQMATVRERARVVGRKVWRSRLAYLFILPSAILVGLFTYYPTLMSIYYSFTNFSLRRETAFVGFDNYATILRDDFYFRTGILNMVIITGAGVVKTLTMPLLAAELVYWLRNARHQYLFRTLFVLPAVVPDLVFALLWKQVYDPNTGLLNQLLTLVGLEEYRQGWLGQDSTALWAIIWVGFPFISAFAFLIYLGGLLNINVDLFDAATIDGASAFTRFRHIDMPLLVPQFRIMLFFAFTGAVQGFASIFILTGGGPGYATYVPALQMYLRIADGEFGYASAIGVILFVIVCVATYFVLHFRRQEIEDA